MRVLYSAIAVLLCALCFTTTYAQQVADSEKISLNSTDNQLVKPAIGERYLPKAVIPNQSAQQTRVSELNSDQDLGPRTPSGKRADFVPNMTPPAGCVDCNWLYKLPVSLDNSAGPALTDYEMKLTVNTAALIGAGKMNADGSDMRFTDGNDCNQMAYYIESGINTAATTVWVNVPSITAAGTTDIFMHYGNAAATAVSSAENTFAFYDGFDGLSTATYSDCGTITPVIAGGNLDLSWSARGMMISDMTFPVGEVYTAEAMMNDTEGRWPAVYWAESGSPHTSYAMMFDQSDARISVKGSGTDFCAGHNWASSFFPSAVDAGLWSITWKDTGDIFGEFPTVGPISSTNTTHAKDQDLQLAIGGISSGTGSMNLDYLRARKHADVVPTDTYGAEVANCVVPPAGCSTDSLPSIFASNAGGNNDGLADGGAIYFDVVIGAKAISLTALEINLFEAIPFSFDVYTLVGGHAGNETNMAAWNGPVAVGTGIGAGNDLPSHASLSVPIILTANTTYGFALVLDGTNSHRYTIDSSVYSNADLTLNPGSATNQPFTGLVFTPRVFNGSLIYETDLVVDCANIFDQVIACRSDLPPVDFNLVNATCSVGNVTKSALTIIPGNSGCPGDEVIITRTYFLQDEAGNQEQCMQTFTVRSDNGPTLTLSNNMFTEDLDGSCEFIVPDYTGLASAMAECSNFGLTISQSPAMGTVVSGVQTLTVTITAEDGCGRTTTEDVTVTLEDNTPAMITCPSDINSVCGFGITYAMPTVVDNCMPMAPITATGYTYMGTFNGNTYFVSDTETSYSAAVTNAQALGANLVTVNDDAENTFIGDALTSVGVGLALIGYNDEAVEGQFVWQNGEPNSYSNWNPGEPNGFGGEDHTTIFNSSLGAIAYLWNDVPAEVFDYRSIIEFQGGSGVVQIAGLPSGSDFPQGTTTNTFRYTDSNGVSVDCSFDVIVDDNVFPTLTCSVGVTTNIDPGECTAVVNLPVPALVENCLPPMPTTLDSYIFLGSLNGHNYFLSSGASNGNQALAAGAAMPGASLATVNDMAENDWIAAQVQAQKALFPWINDNVFIGFNDVASEGTFVWQDGHTNEGYTNWGPGEPNDSGGEDWTGLNSLNLTWNDFQLGANFRHVLEFSNDAVQTSGLPTGSAFPIGINPVTWSYTDIGGNTATCGYDVEVIDNVAPQIVNCVGSVQSANANCEFVGGGGSFTIIENCGNVDLREQYFDQNGDMFLDLTFNLPPGAGYSIGGGRVYPLGVNTVRLTVTDDAGLSDVCELTVEVIDDTPPIVTVSDMFLFLDDTGYAPLPLATVLANATITDNCSDVFTYSLDITEFFGPDIYPVTLTVTDEAGNPTSVTFNVDTREGHIPTAETIIIYPNPIQNLFSLKIDEVWEGPFTATLYDMAGNYIVHADAVKDARVYRGVFDFMQARPNGQYILVLDTPDGQKTVTAIKQD